jgi:hypothetical protein
MLDTTPRFRSVNQPTHVVSPRSPAMVYTCLSQLSEERTNALFFPPMEMRSLNGPSPKEEKPILSTRVGLAHASSEKKRDVDPPHNGPPHGYC